MKSKKLVSKIIAIGGAVCLALSMFVCPVSTLPVQAATPAETEIQPLSYTIEWVFRIVDNKLYRRLYNYSIGTWIGEWEYVGDLS